MGDDNKIYITNSSHLPEVTITAPRKYFVGYDENVNPVYTTDRMLSQDYLQSQIPIGSAEQKRRQWTFENVGANGQTKPGIQGDAKNISRLVTAGIGSTLAPIAVAPVARAVFPAVRTLASAGRTTWNAIKPGGTIPNWLYRQTFTPQGTLTSGATELLGSTVAGEGFNEILNQKSKSGDWTEDVDHKYFHGDIGNTIGEEGRNMFLTAPLYGTYNVGKQMMNGVKNLERRFVSPYVIAREINLATKNKPKYTRVPPKNLFRTQVYKGGEIIDPYSNFVTTDPLYAANYGKVTPYIFESKSVAKAKEPMIGYKDPVSLDMFIYNNTKENPNATAIIGHDAITGEFVPSKGIEILNMDPKNLYPVRTSKSPTSLIFFERKPSKLTQAERLGIPKGERFVPKWHVANYPGYQLKGLMKGSLLERLLSKNGTININLLNAYFNKASQVEREVANKVLAEKFSGQKTIDYNLFKKAVLDELIGGYNRVPLTEYADYGIDRLGFKSGPTLSRQDFLNFLLRNPNINGIVSEDGLGITRFNPDGGATLLRPRDLLREYGNWMDLPNFKTFTFETSRIPYGNTKHYRGNPIGHSRTYTLPEDPHTLYVMESQSDWALLALRKKGSIDAQSAYERASLTATKYLQEIEQMKANLEKGLAPDGHKIQYEWERRDIEEIIKNTEKQLASNNTRMARFDAILHPEKYALENYLKQNYLQRQLQENLRYAAEKGLTKMRYPTPETAAKIEGYKPQTNYGFDSTSFDDLSTNLQKHNKQVFEENDWDLEGMRESWIRLFESHPDNEYILQHALEGRPLKYDATTLNLIGKARNSLTKTFGYKPEHQTILKKYADFPKLFLKLYKDLKVRTVTDTKGNTWYEVDVPKGYLNREWLFKQGGKINNK